MKRYKVLCLTDHGGHSKENSLYAIISAIASHQRCHKVDVASRSNPLNKAFFYEHDFSKLFTVSGSEEFGFDESRKALFESKHEVNPSDYDIIFLRLPRPTSDEFLIKLESSFESKCIINKPSGILKCGNKSVLLNFPSVCPPIMLCHSIEDIISFSAHQDIVLKPLKEYGGKGLLRIKDNVLNDGHSNHAVLPYLQNIESFIQSEGFLAMKYLKNVNQGDKRLIVVGGEVLSSSLRLPAENSWLCNVALGGKSVKSDPDERELEIIREINPFLIKNGILIYGADTLVDDDGHRTLSEINALSIGGFPQAEKQSGKPVIKLTIEKIFAHADVYST